MNTKTTSHICIIQIPLVCLLFQQNIGHSIIWYKLLFSWKVLVLPRYFKVVYKNLDYWVKSILLLVNLLFLSIILYDPIPSCGFIYMIQFQGLNTNNCRLWMFFCNDIFKFVKHQEAKWEHIACKPLLTSCWWEWLYTENCI